MIDDATQSQAVVLDVAKSAEVARLGPHRGLNQCPISPDGRWVATATWKGKDVKVWEVATGRLAWQLPCDSAFVRFSPDGRWLAVAKFPGLECRLWHVGSWHPGPMIQVSKEFFIMAFSRDGRLLAIDDAGRVRLVDPDPAGRSRRWTRVPVPRPISSAWLSAPTALTWRPAGITSSTSGTFGAFASTSRPMGLDWDSPPYPPPDRNQPLGPVVLVNPTGERG